MADYNHTHSIEAFLKKDVMWKLPKIAPPESRRIEVVPFRIAFDGTDCRFQL